MISHYVAISGGVGALILLMSGSWLYKFIKTRNQLRLQKKLFKQNGGLLLQQQLSSPEGNVNRSKHFCLQELERATDNFNEDRVLGRGGQGTVYKGMLKDGRIVAVKKPKSLDVDEANVEQFINEICILSQINHRNVVKLLGCCLDTKFPLLVYEFIPNGTLYQYLHDRRDDLPFTWDVRLRVATEVAGALSYLHSAASIPIYHKDIKTMNILLDDKYRAKIADFGTSKSVSLDQTHVTTMVQGTFGYLDPEFFQSGQFTDKSDVYSFGVVLVELLTRQKPSSSSRVHGGVGLATHFVISMEEDCVLDIVDPEVLNLGNKEEIMAVADLARRCLDLSGRKRPAMKEVAMELYGIRKSQQQQSEDQRGQFEEVEAIEACNTGFTSRRSKSKAEVMLLMDSHPFLTTDTIC